MVAPAAALQSVTVKYSSQDGIVVALHDVSLKFPAKSSTAIIGRSGAGKSTLVSVLALLRKPTSGELVLDMVKTSTLSAGEMARLRSSEIGIVFQAFHLESSLTTLENVMLPWYFRSAREPRSAARRRAAYLLDALGIGHLAPRAPNQTSGGQRQRIAIARALFPEPTLFIADEPTGNLDEDTANGVADAIFSLPSALGTTVVVVTHDGDVAARAGRRVKLTKGHLGEDT
jgi:predicted ABC-type transport system involved in lysophospholipase L1 biosynthesis ATPase subunit